MNTFYKAAAVIAVATFAATGCASKTGTGAIIGAGSGGALGAIIGNAKGSTAKGAIIGAIAGGAAGALIGRQMDKQAEEIEREIPGAKVERVGEGILVTFDSGILFDFNSDVLKPAARENLRELATSLKTHAGSNALLVGHTDAVGADTYNQTLSERRASAAADFLRSQGIERARIDATGRGEAEPVSTNDAENRRVEVAIYASEAYRREVSKRN